MTLPIILALASLSLILAAIVNESGRRVGGITFYSLGRYRFTICKGKGK